MPSLLYQLLKERFTGEVMLQAPSGVSKVYCRDGCPVYVELSENAELIGRLLVELRVLDDASLRKALGAMEPGKRLGEVALEQGLCDEAALIKALRLQVARKLAPLFRLSSGGYAILPGAHQQGMQGNTSLAVNPLWAILYALRLCPPARLMQLLAPVARRVLGLRLPEDRMAHYSFNAEEQRLLTAWRSEPRVPAELLAQKPDLASVALPLWCALEATSALELGEERAAPWPPPGLRLTPQAEKRPTPSAMQAVRADHPKGTGSQPTLRAPSGLHPTVDKHPSQDRIERLDKAEKAADPRPPSGPVKTEKPPEARPPSGSVKLPERPPSGPVPIPSGGLRLPPPGNRIRSLLERGAHSGRAQKAPVTARALTPRERALFLIELEHRSKLAAFEDYFTILGVGEGADAAEVERAYIALSARLDSDRLTELGLSPFQSQAGRLLSRATEARAVLKDAERRKKYLDSYKTEVRDEAKQAEEKQLRITVAMARAMVFLKERDFAPAVTELEQAMKLTPEHPEARGLLAFANYSMNKISPEEALRVLQLGLKSDNLSGRYIYYAGLLFKQAGQDAEAMPCFKRAQVLDKDLVEAGSELRFLEARAKKAGGTKAAATSKAGTTKAGEVKPPTLKDLFSQPLSQTWRGLVGGGGKK